LVGKVGWEHFEMFELEWMGLGNFEIEVLKQVVIVHSQKAEMELVAVLQVVALGLKQQS